MAEKEFDLGEYLTGGVEKIVKSAIRATLKDPKESIFMARYESLSSTMNPFFSIRETCSS